MKLNGPQDGSIVRWAGWALRGRSSEGALSSEKAISMARSVGLTLAGSLFVALCAQITFYLPVNPVPVTGQTFGVLIVGALLGSRLGAAALTAYLFEGAMGLAVFAPGVTPGIARLVSPTAGYLFAFVLAAFLVGRLAESGWLKRLPTAVLALGLGLAVIYLGGVAWLSLFISPEKAFAIGVVPFIVGDLFKLGAASLIAYRRA